MIDADHITGCYLICFDRPLHNSRHYLGWAKDIGARFRLHQAGCSGVRYIEAVIAAGIKLELVRIWPGYDRKQERELKGYRGRKRKGSLGRRLCPVCKPILRDADRKKRKSRKNSTALSATGRPAARAATNGT